MTPYYADDDVTLYHGDCRTVVPDLGLTADCIVTDPPYGETSLAWDRWSEGWPTAVSGAAKSMWCFGSMRMFLEHREEFEFWKLSQDVVWDRGNGVAFSADRFLPVHEVCLHWYRGTWAEAYHDPPRVMVDPRAPMSSSSDRSGQTHGKKGAVQYDQRYRLLHSVFRGMRPTNAARSHPTEKPVGILDPLIRYACPLGGVVLDCFAGSGSTAEAARLSGRKAILVEADERYCELIARRMSQGVLPEATA